MKYFVDFDSSKVQIETGLPGNALLGAEWNTLVSRVLSGVGKTNKSKWCWCKSERETVEVYAKF
jgi:hypothetical protein